MIPLGLLSPGDQGEIAEIRIQEDKCSTGCCGAARTECDCRVEEMGIRVGKRVEMLNNGAGPVLLRVDESRIAIARGMAMKIMVKEILQ